jgi:23S rRNA (adenine2503-C2)-methyltransferase
MINLKGLEQHELESLAEKEGESSYRGRQLFSWIYQKGIFSFQEMTNLSQGLRDRFSSIWNIQEIEAIKIQHSEERDAAKFLFQLKDGERIESVLMYFENRLSVCLSTQVGCAFKCAFCASGLKGWKRNLESWEIVDQFLQIQKRNKDRISNIVFMGIGEPLNNYDNTMKAIKILHDPLGAGIGMRHITISTVGIVPEIRKLAEEGAPIRLAVSLHAPVDELRGKLLPINKKYKISELIEACRYYQSKIRRRISFEYTLIKGVNDDLELAKKLASLVKGIICHVNLIPLNPMSEYPHQAPDSKHVRAFQFVLEKSGIPASVRQERGQDIQAACGQLRLEMENRKVCA